MSNKTRIKICGLTSVDDAIAAAGEGADAVGLVFYGKSPRFVDIQTAQKIAHAVGPFVTLVGLFVNAPVAEVKNILRQVPLQLLQFHGDESNDYCREFDRPYIKALRVRSPLDQSLDAIAEISAQLHAECIEYSSAQGILLDAYSSKGYGGTGEQFNWKCIPELPNPLPLILAGGLHPDNVAMAIEQTKPYGVDVSSGVESSPGIKDREKMRNFIVQARGA